MTGNNNATKYSVPPRCYGFNSLSRLTTHDVIPTEEIWIKLGGDKGGGSVKINFQIVNCVNPNSVTNTCVFRAFEAADTATNLHVALDQYKSQVSDLQKLVWRYNHDQ